jgi:hypothetical protein
MVLKKNLIQGGWSYGNGDDQYDNESLGSTITAVKTEKLVKNSMKNKKNEYDEKMCSRQEDKHTIEQEQEWTTVEANSNHKPKSKTNRSTTIDSIISSIDIEFNIDTNGTIIISTSAIEQTTTKIKIVRTQKKKQIRIARTRQITTTTTIATETTTTLEVATKQE